MFHRDSGVWTLGYAGVVVRLPHAKGLRDLATLLGAPGREVHVFELVGVREPRAGADPMLDATAKAAYQARLADLDEQIAAADADHDLERAAVRRAERDFLIRELTAAVGLGRRARRLGDETERARKTVLARIRHVLARLDRVHPVLAAHLAESIRTGTPLRLHPGRAHDLGHHAPRVALRESGDDLRPKRRPGCGPPRGLPGAATLRLDGLVLSGRHVDSLLGRHRANCRTPLAP